jgi:hypothetical protein
MIFSTIVVIDGVSSTFHDSHCRSWTLTRLRQPLLQRSSLVVSAPIQDQQQNVTVQIAHEVPTDFSGARTASQEFSAYPAPSPPFNETMPGGDGTRVPNTMFPLTQTAVEGHLGRLYYSDAPFADVLQGCGDKCRARVSRSVDETVLTSKTCADPFTY